MGRTVDELLRSISCRELREWMVYYSIEPWGEEREDVRMGIMASTFVNVHSKKKFKPADFIPNWDQSKAAKQPQKMTWQEQMLNMKLVSALQDKVIQTERERKKRLEELEGGV